MDLEVEIKAALTKQASLQKLRNIVTRYKKTGGTQKDAYTVLEKVRYTYTEETSEDLILDLMDFVSGFCSKEQRIWDEVLTH